MPETLCLQELWARGLPPLGPGTDALLRLPLRLLAPRCVFLLSGPPPPAPPSHRHMHILWLPLYSIDGPCFIPLQSRHQA